MTESENNFYEFDSETNKLKFYSDEFSNLLDRCGLQLTNIELDNSCDIVCYLEKVIDYENWHCNKFEEILKKNIPFIQDIYYEEGYFIITFNVETVDLF
jgi:hypothetical protein